jgi:hypothetical protein
LAVHPGALGDLVLFGRLLERLGGPVTLLAGGEKGKLLRRLGVAARTLDFDALPMQELFLDKPAGECKLPQLLGQHDRLISCFGGDDPKMRRRLTDFCGAGSADFLPIKPTPDWNSHLLDLWDSMLATPASQPAGWHCRAVRRPACNSSTARHPRGVEGLPFEGPMSSVRTTYPAIRFAAWRPSNSMRRDAQKTLADAGCHGKYAVIHPGAGSIAKCWPLERFMELAAIVRRRLPVVFIVGPAEIEWWQGPALLSIRERFPLILQPPLGVLAGILAGASLYVGNDSGVSHLAAAVGAPTIALFGPTSSTHFAPLGPRVRLAPFASSPAGLSCRP